MNGNCEIQFLLCCEHGDVRDDVHDGVHDDARDDVHDGHARGDRVRDARGVRDDARDDVHDAHVHDGVNGGVHDDRGARDDVRVLCAPRVYAPRGQ